MKTLIIYHSEHHGNTEKVARAISKVFNADLLTSSDADIDEVSEYDLVGFGSGIYYGKFHQSMYSILDRLPNQEEKKSFVFSTTGSKTYSERAHDLFTSKLEGKGFEVIGDFSCLGFDTALSSEGVNRGRPNDNDLRAAEKFARELQV